MFKLLKNIAVAALTCLFIFSCGTHIKKDIELPPPNTKTIEMDKAKIILDDGDTFTYDSTTFRFLGIDTPEITHVEHGFLEDQPFGREAAAFTAEAIAKAKTVTYVPYRNDHYGRTLAHIFVDGDLLGIKLIKAGLAYETISQYGDNGYPELAKRILEAASQSQVKDFIQPSEWRKQHKQVSGE